MVLEYGIGICEETLKRLNSSAGLATRVASAFDEITVFETEDACPDHFKRRNELYNLYIDIGTYSIGASGMVNDKTERLRNFETELRKLCADIIVYNKAHFDNE